jgi:ESS family glutamate:Na+ symporter
MKLAAKGQGAAAKSSTTVIKTFAILFFTVCLQVLVGLVTRQIFAAGGMDLYLPFGYELTEGFAGGHGTAGVVGSFYKQLNLPYWEIAQGVTTTTATFGLVGGMIIGIAVINVAARRSKTSLLKKPADLPPDEARGFQMDIAKQPGMGRETTKSSSIESQTFHLAIILVGCGIAYILMGLVKKYKVPLISQVPIWAYAIVVMFAVNYIIQKLGLGNLIEPKTKSRIASTLSDFAITAAIASIPVQAVMLYIVPILVLVVAGFLITYLSVFNLAGHFFKGDHPVERSVACWGTSSGVFLTGLMLLKITDPDFKLPVLNDYSIAFSMFSICGFVLMPLTVNTMLHAGFVHNLALQGGLALACLLLLIFADRIAKLKK